MKKLDVNFRKGYAKVQTENADDLWYLSQVIEKGDLVSGKALRKIKIGGETDRSSKVVKKALFVTIRVEQAEFSESQLSLRVLGTVEEGTDDVAKGEHQSITIEENTTLTITKEWLGYQKDRMEESFSSKISTILLVVFDREEALFALMKKYGYELLAQLKGNVAKKDMESGKITNFYAEIIAQISEYDKRLSLDSVVLGSPAFWKDELLKNLNDDSLKKKMVLATCSSVDKSGITELLKRDEVQSVLSLDRTAKELLLVEQLLKEISSDGKAAYGLKEVSSAASSGAIGILLVSDAFIQKCRAENSFYVLEAAMKTADQSQAKVHIVSSAHEGGKKLDGLGGVGALLRFKV